MEIVCSPLCLVVILCLIATGQLNGKKENEQWVERLDHFGCIYNLKFSSSGNLCEGKEDIPDKPRFFERTFSSSL